GGSMTRVARNAGDGFAGRPNRVVAAHADGFLPLIRPEAHPAQDFARLLLAVQAVVLLRMRGRTPDRHLLLVAVAAGLSGRGVADDDLVRVDAEKRGVAGLLCRGRQSHEKRTVDSSSLRSSE